jgi:hypothetical protein
MENSYAQKVREEWEAMTEDDKRIDRKRANEALERLKSETESEDFKSNW